MTDPRVVADRLTQIAAPVRLRLVARLLGGAASVEANVGRGLATGVGRDSLKAHPRAMRRRRLMA